MPRPVTNPRGPELRSLAKPEKFQPRERRLCGSSTYNQLLQEAKAEFDAMERRAKEMGRKRFYGGPS